jgi:pilus assembly protein CpaF
VTDFFSDATASFFKPISRYLSDPEVTEVMVNGAFEIYVEKKGRIFKTDSQFEDEEQLMSAVRRVAQAVGRQVDEGSPALDARLSDGSRVSVLLPPCARKGIYLSIRKFAAEVLTVKQLVEGGALSIPMAKFLNLCVSLSKNLIVSGGTSSGKTTLLNVISSLIPDDQRIIVIEDASELKLLKEHLLPMESTPEVTIRDLLKSSLRMRPDRIVIGEVRGGEAFDLLQAMNTGHSGCMATVHANSPKDAMARVETLAMMSDVNLPWRAMRSQVASAIDILVQTTRLRDGTRKITHISESRGLNEAGDYQVDDLFVHEIESVDDKGTIKGKHIATGTYPSFLEEAKAQGFTVDETLFEN